MYISNTPNNNFAINENQFYNRIKRLEKQIKLYKDLQQLQNELNNQCPMTEEYIKELNKLNKIRESKKYDESL